MAMEPVEFLTSTKSTKYPMILNNKMKWSQLDREISTKADHKTLEVMESDVPSATNLVVKLKIVEETWKPHSNTSTNT